VKTQDALSLLIALEERVARVYFHFFRTFRDDRDVARCWWDMARDEYGHVGILKMVRDLVSPEAEAGQIGARLWSLVDVVERCEQEASAVESLSRALELAIQLESSELDALGHRIVQSLRSELPEGAARPFIAADSHCQRLVEAAGKVPDLTLRQRLETMLGGAKGR
jgi:rubrerythrin